LNAISNYFLHREKGEDQFPGCTVESTDTTQRSKVLNSTALWSKEGLESMV